MRIGERHRERVVEYKFCDLERHLVSTPIAAVLLLVPNPAQDRTSRDYKFVVTERSVNPRNVRAGRAKPSFDDLIGEGKQRIRHGQTKGFGGFEIDDKFKL